MLITSALGLDFETYGGVDLPTHGLHRYTSCSTFRPLIAGTSQYVDRAILPGHTRFDFVASDSAVADLRHMIKEHQYIVAHNAGFEQRTLETMGIKVASERFIDSAVVARALGAGSSLEAAAPQLLGVDKMEAGKHLIKLFSIPGVYQETNGSREFDPAIVADHLTEWQQFKEYCDLDSLLGLRIGLRAQEFDGNEIWNQAVTMDMNNIGWPVDVPLVEEMQRRYLDNIEQAEHDFRQTYGAHDLNLNSLKQMKEWCEARGIKAKSFDQKAVEKMIAAIGKKLDAFDAGTSAPAPSQYENYCEVLALLETKQVIGGSSLKKLQVILDTTGKDMRLKDQYIHIGAGQSWRTTGRSVQMQNLKRLGGAPADMSELDDPANEWDNEQLAANLRQTFTSSHEQGRLIVGDFKSVESRGLAWLACADWKLEAYRQGKDMYRVLAADMFGKSYDLIPEKGEERQAGKVGELSCGYQAGSDAVQSFAAGMSIKMTEAEAADLVRSWRATNPEVVDLWARLNQCLQEVVAEHQAGHRTKVGQGFMVEVMACSTPASLLKQHPKGATSILVRVIDQHGSVFLERYFHGCYMRGRNICYYKPSMRKTGDLWSSHFINPKTKQLQWYTIYGGKLTGILTQSFCRELFFRSLRQVHQWTKGIDNVDLIGQFHDEIVLDWHPLLVGSDHRQVTLEGAEYMLNQYMSDASGIPGFPLEADIKHDYRYTK